MKRILKGLFLAAAGLLLLGVGILAAIWWKPSRLLNERNVRWAMRYAPNGFEARWSSFSWTFRAEGFWGKGTVLEIRDLCVHYGHTDGCAPELKLDASFSIARFHPRITRLRSLRVLVSSLRLGASPPDAPLKRNAQPLPDLRPPSFAGIIPKELDLDRIGDVDVDAQRVVIEKWRGPSLEIAARLHKVDGPGARFSLGGVATQQGALELSFTGDGEILARQQTFAAQGKAGGHLNGWRIILPFEGRWSDSISLRGRAVATNAKNRFATPVSLDWRPDRFLLRVARLSIDDLWPKKRLSIDDCKLEGTLERRHGFPSASKLHCDLSLIALKQGAILPPLRAKLSAELGLAPVRGDAFDIDFQLHELGTNDFLDSRIEAAFRGRFLPRLGEPEGTPKIDLAVNLKVPELVAWRRALDRTPFAIPAPFRALTGPATIDVRLEKESRDAITARADVNTFFSGGRQVFKTASEAHVTITNPWHGKKGLAMTARAELSDVALEAPPLKLETPPQFLPDRRIEATREQVQAMVPQSSIPFHWQLAVATRNPLRIRSNLIENEVPLALDLAFADDADMSGSVKLLEMPLQVFKKKAEVKHVNVVFHDGSKQGEIDGLAIYRNPEITIQILLLGSTDKPRVEFLSSPPLNRSQIVSVLLFNKSVSELTDEEAASAGSFSEATADGALGLFSLLFLSSTPIESISYDPVSQTYAARVRLGDKTTLSVGSDFEHERQVALRRRLSGRWAIRTELHDEEGKPDVLLTLLEWFKRF